VTEQQAEGREFLGAGLAFPLGLDPDGRLRMTALEDHVRQSIQLIMETARGERVMRPDFGTGLRGLVFAPASAGTMALVQHEVEEALIRHEPRIDVVGVQVAVDPAEAGRLLVQLRYRVRRTDTMFNLVYPFYLDRSTP
jgi:phage baseplate assembly protein W